MQLNSSNIAFLPTAVGNHVQSLRDAESLNAATVVVDSRAGAEPWVSQTRVVAAIAVVLLHVAAAGVDVKDRELLSTANWEFSNCVDSSVRWCVPIFVMLSGYLLLDPSKTESIEVFARKRLSRIAIPLLFWSVFYTAWRVAAHLAVHKAISIRSFVEGQISGAPYYHLWFLYMIVGLYIFTPFLRKLVKSLDDRDEILLCLAFFVFASFTELGNYLLGVHIHPFTSLFAPYLGYFLFGDVVRRHRFNISTARLAAVVCLCIAVNILGTRYLVNLYGVSEGLYFYSFCSATVIPMSVAIFLYLRQMKVTPRLNGMIELLSATSFGVYLVHPIFLDVARFFGVTAATMSPLIVIPAMSISVYALSVGTTAAMLRIPYLSRIV